MISRELEAQRNLSKIDRQQLGYLVVRGKERWEVYKTMEGRVTKLGLFNDPRIYEFSRDQLFEHMEYISNEIYRNVGADNINVNYVYETATASNVHLRGSVGLVMVIQLILVLGTEEQKALFLPNINDFKWTTAYAQTELAHGSDVDSIKTLAVYDELEDVFVVNTPNLESYKWWPGDLALGSTHILLVARLIAKGVDHGVQCFFIQIRDLKTHKLLPGVESGDIGPKIGYNSKDNGWVAFKNYKVPRITLLAKYIQISREGDVTKSGNDRVKYTGMMMARTLLLMSSYYNMLRCTTILTRYSVLRKQFKDDKGKEIRIFDYQLQKYKIVKHLSKAYAMSLGLYTVMDLIKKNEENVQKNDFSLFQQIHLLLCECKAYFTWWDNACVSESIIAAGGHGFSSYSGFTTPFVENFPNQILEGENTLLCLQVSRYLLNLVNKITKGDTTQAIGQFSYLIMSSELEEFKPAATKEDLTNPKVVIQILQKNSAYFVQKTGMNFMKFTMEGMDMKDVFNSKMGYQLLNMGKCHSILVITEHFLKKLESLPEGPIKTAIKSLAVVYTHEIFKEFSVNLLESGSITGEHLTILNELMEEHLEKLTPDILVLAEALQIPDEALGSAIAANNGKPYDNLYTWAKNYGSMNQFPDGVHPAIIQQKKKLNDHRL